MSTFTVRKIGGSCPTQAYGRTAKGRPYYFRFRFNHWTLQVGDVDDADEPDTWLCHADLVAEGEGPNGPEDRFDGDMESGDVLGKLDHYLRGL